MTTLPRDFCRCIDSACPMRLDCLRFLDRNNRDVNERSFAASLRKPDGSCDNQIKPQKPA